MHRFGSSRTSEVGEDNGSIRSYFALRSPPESESIFGGVLDDGHDTITGLVGDTAPDIYPGDVFAEAEVDFEHEFEDVDADGEDEEHVHTLWKAKKKHFLILSAAGKPIYTRHGSDQTISSYIGIIQTIISSYESADDPLKSFQAGNAKFVILAQNNLFLVAISSLPESDPQLRSQLDALYMQILSTLTLPTLTHIFSVRPSTDLRRPLQGTEVLLSALADSFTRGSPSTLLSSLECLKLRKSHRTVINNTLIKARVDDLLYGLIVAGARLVSVIRPKKHSLHPSDLQLIFNMLFEADGIQAGGGDSWIPICLPGFNKTGYLFMYVSFLSLSANGVAEDLNNKSTSNFSTSTPAKQDTIAIILLSANKESFPSMQSMKRYLVAELHRTNSIHHIQHSLRHTSRPSPTDIVPGTALRHFLYKSKPHVQFFMPSFSPDFESLTQRRQLMTVYHCLHASVHAKGGAVKVYHSVSPTASALAWVTPLFELYCVARSTTARNALAQSANRVVQWVGREEERVFIIGGAVF